MPAWFWLSCLLFITIAASSLAEAGDDPWRAIISPGASVEKLAGGFGFTEGPLWHPAGYLLFSDSPADAIMKWTPGIGIAVFRHPAGPPNGMTFDPQGRLLVCETGVRVSRTERDGKIVPVATHYEGKRFNSPNDIVARADGMIFFTDPTYGMRKPDPDDAATAPLGHRGVYRVAPDGTVTLLDKEFRQPNGIALSPDQKTLYVADSERLDVRAYDLSPDGSVANPRTFAVLKEPGKEGVPDGLKTDTKGNVYCTGPGAVWVFSPDGGLLGKIAVPEVPANVAFGGPGGKDLFITARTGLYRVRVKTPGVLPGSAPSPARRK